MVGRPKMAPEDRRRQMLRIRLTDEEHAAITAAAERAEQKVSDFVRSITLAHIGAAQATSSPDTGESA